MIESVGQIFYSPTWYYSSRYTYAYTPFDSIATEQNYTWNNTTSVWDNSAKWLYTYNADKQLTQRKTEVFSAASSSWVNNRNETYEYNSDKDNVAVDYYQDWLPASGYYDYHVRQEYKCTYRSSSISNISESSSLKIYPNPVTNNQLYIDSKSEQTFSLLNISGQLLQSGTLVRGTNKINLNNVSSGLYFIKIGTDAKKIIIQ